MNSRFTTRVPIYLKSLDPDQASISGSADEDSPISFTKTSRKPSQNRICLRILKKREAELAHLSSMIEGQLKNIRVTLENKNRQRNENKRELRYSKLRIAKPVEIAEYDRVLDRPKSLRRIPKNLQHILEDRKSSSIIITSKNTVRNSLQNLQNDCSERRQNSFLLPSTCKNSGKSLKKKTRNCVSSILNNSMPAQQYRSGRENSFSIRRSLTKSIEKLKLEMVRNSKSITYSLLASVITLKKITKKDSLVLSKFCQLINASRNEHCQENKSFNTKKSQIMFIQRSLYFISNEVLLLSKKINNSRTHNNTFLKENIDKQNFLKELYTMLNKNIVVASDPSEFCSSISVLYNYIKSVYEYLRQLIVGDVSVPRTPKSICSKKSKRSGTFSNSKNSKPLTKNQMKGQAKESHIKSRNKICLPKMKKFRTNRKKSSCQKRQSSVKKSRGRGCDISTKKSETSICKEKSSKRLKTTPSGILMRPVPRINCFLTNYEDSEKGFESREILIKEKPDFVNLVINKPQTTKSKKTVFDFHRDQSSSESDVKLENTDSEVKPSEEENINLPRPENAVKMCFKDFKNQILVKNEASFGDTVELDMFDNPQSDTQCVATLPDPVSDAALEEEKATDTEENINPLNFGPDKFEFCKIKMIQTMKNNQINKEFLKKESLTTIEEQSFDISNDCGTNRSHKFSSLISCEPFDLEEPLHNQLPNDKFKFEIEDSSQSEYSDNLLESDQNLLL
ncbi:unnamed protein product [Moneuplotes crassus]|uniref:Uncharacterized protein n=1 Tax=Euplotes crassus TaxID=5936 RepID=A0AAD1Y6R1_EUPCR|nr:unnamed protein product [Moneuplotes crassus]